MNSSVEPNPLISLRDVSLRREGREILSRVNLDINPGDFVVITGANGGGKTTLLRLMLGLLKPSTGSVNCALRPGSIGYLPQKSTIDAHFPLTVGEVVASGLPPSSSLSRIEAAEAVREALDAVRLSDLTSRAIGRLSGGQLQRALIARAIVSTPPLLVLDEPLSYIDKQMEGRVCEIIDSFASHSTVIVVTHRLGAIGSRANRHLIVERSVEECHNRDHAIEALRRRS